MMTWPQQLKYYGVRFGALLLPKPYTGSLWSDFFYLLVVIALQVAILPSLLRSQFVDLLTTWLAFIFIVQSTPRALILGCIAALTLENHGTAPAGLYICSYWIMATLIILVRKHISWRSLLPWMTTFAFSQLWIILFESFVYLIKSGGMGFVDMHYGVTTVLRMMVALLLGFVISRQGHYPIAEDKSA